MVALMLVSVVGEKTFTAKTPAFVPSWELPPRINALGKPCQRDRQIDLTALHG
jgi:hypothetical protein